ncbi:MAG: MerR family transcriptional regulator [Firmicutes bacterium]|nr:MerR family transcriptional regulator [Bacillota bacterium]
MSTSGKTLSKAAQEVGVEPSTIKYWCEEFSNFIRPARTPGGHRRFSSQDIQDLRYLRQLLHVQNFSIKQAKDYLNNLEGRIPDIQASESFSPTLPAISPAGSHLAQELARFLTEQLETVNKEHLRSLQDAVEQTAAAILDEVKELESQRFTQWGQLLEHTVNIANERVLSTIDLTLRDPTETDEVDRIYTEARDRWLTEEAKARMEIQRLRHELEEIQKQSLWQRLLWALFGRVKKSTETDSQHKHPDLPD